MNVRAERFPLMDSLRAVAALSVLMFHAGYFAGLLKDDFFAHRVVARFDVGVTIFFLISGFLLYRPFVRARLRDEDPPATGAYAWRRFLRIVPAYWVALTLVTVVLTLPHVFTATGIPLFYGFAQIYDKNLAFGGIPQAWTLCIEITFYAFLPLWALGMRKLSGGRTPRERMARELVGLALLFAASVAWKVVALKLADLHSPEPQVALMPLGNFLDQFALGMGLAVLSVWYEDQPGRLPGPLRLLDRFPSLAWAMAFLALLAVSTVAMPAGFGQAPTGQDFLLRHELYGVVALGMVLPAVFGDPQRGLVRRILGNRVLLFLGLVSYGLYLYQLAVVSQLTRWDFNSVAQAVYPPIMWPIATFVGSLILATASYYGIERYALRLKGLVGPRRVGPPEEATAEPAPAMAPAGPSR
jgi:peptidoglycan/LPS O-acetylase OafA/YrhL